MIVDLKYDREGHLRRWCPICGRIMPFREFEIMDGDDISLRVWEDERLSIPCCNCYHLVLFFRDNIVIRDNVEEYGSHLIEFENRVNKARTSFWLDVFIYDFFKKGGFFNG